MKRLAGLVILAIVISGDVLTTGSQVIRGVGGDWQSFLASGRALSEGLNPYAPHPLTWSMEFAGVSMSNVNLNPPISLLALAPLAYTDPGTSYHLWVLVSAALLALSVAVLLWRYPFSATLFRLGWIFALAGLWDLFNLGQIYAPLILMMALAWLAMAHDRLTIAGLLLGLALAVKPNFAVWALFLFLSGYRRPAVVSVITACLLSIVPAAVYGPEIYLDWLRATTAYAGGIITVNGSIAGVVSRLGLPWLYLPLAGLLVLTLAWHLYRHPQPLATVSGLGLVTSLLASPLAWVTYSLFLLPVFLSRQRWTKTWIWSAVLLSVPAFVIFNLGTISPTASALAGMVYPAALCCLLMGLLRTEKDSALINYITWQNSDVTVTGGAVDM